MRGKFAVVIIKIIKKFSRLKRAAEVNVGPGLLHVIAFYGF